MEKKKAGKAAARGEGSPGPRGGGRRDGGRTEDGGGGASAASSVEMLFERHQQNERKNELS